MLWHGCRNLNIEFMTKYEVQGLMRLKVCLGVKHILTNGGECKGWSPMTPKCTLILGITFMLELWINLEPWLKSQTSAKLGSQETIRIFLKHRCLKYPHIVHLDMICMNYDKKKGQESNWEFDSRPQVLGK